MNRSMILYVVGHVVMLEGVMLLLPCLVSLIYQESEGIDYLVMAVICMLLGAIIVKHKPKVNVFYLKEGCIATALSWIALSIFGALPMCISGDIPSFTDALFETISGFTTTGASILNYNRICNPGRYRGSANGNFLLAKLYTLDRWHGCAGVSACGIAA